MAWDVRKTYYYLVCLVTLLLSIYGGVQAVQDVLDLAWPDEPHVPTEMDMWQRFNRPDMEAQEPSFTREELRQMVEEQRAEQERRVRRQAVRDLVGHLVLLAVALPIYGYHWRHVRRFE